MVRFQSRVNILAKSANKFNLENNREKFQLEKNSDLLSTLLCFMDIFPVVDESIL